MTTKIASSTDSTKTIVISEVKSVSSWLADYRTRTVLRIHLELQIIHSLFFIKNSFERPRRRPCRVAGVKLSSFLDMITSIDTIPASKYIQAACEIYPWRCLANVRVSTKFDEKHR